LDKVTITSSKGGPLKHILISLDGTSSDASDAEESTDRRGETVDEGISSILRLHLLAGGRLDNDRWRLAEQPALYFSGVGTRGPKLAAMVSSALALKEPKAIRDEAYAALCEVYESGDAVSIIGFSRGAAIGRMLAGTIDDKGVNGQEVAVSLLGCLDTVAAFGGVTDPRDEPHSSELEEDGRIARKVTTAWHLVGLDEARGAFRATPMGAEERVHELWFSGVHADVGGTFGDHQLADGAMHFLRDRLAENGFRFLGADGVDYDDLGGDAVVTQEDVDTDPDPVHGQLHTQVEDGSARDAANPGLQDRVVHVAVADEVTDKPPLMHHSVLDRIDGNTGYAPTALPARYRVWEADGSVSDRRPVA
jgi:uncharacterized protein (DUF2235 family)